MPFDPSFDPEDALELSPEARLREIAAILAAGLIRLHERAAVPTDPVAGESQQFVQKGLEESG